MKLLTKYGSVHRLGLGESKRTFPGNYKWPSN